MRYILVLLLLIVACSGQAPIELSEANARYDGEQAVYEFVVNKPTPCHEVVVTERVIGAQVDIQVRLDSGSFFCARVIDTERVTGSVNVSQRPTVRINNEIVFQ